MFGTKAAPCSVDLLNEAAKDYARRYYCHAENYVHMELDGNIFDGKSLPRGPAMCYLVKFMEEIIGFKTVPGKLFSIDPQGKPLPKAFHKSYPPVGFDNNFQPEAYAAAENKIAYMRNLTIVQKILAVQWMAMGEHAFREDLEPLYTAKERSSRSTCCVGWLGFVEVYSSVPLSLFTLARHPLDTALVRRRGVS